MKSVSASRQAITITYLINEQNSRYKFSHALIDVFADNLVDFRSKLLAHVLQLDFHVCFRLAKIDELLLLFGRKRSGAGPQRFPGDLRHQRIALCEWFAGREQQLVR